MKLCRAFLFAVQATMSYSAFTNPGLIVSWETGERQTITWSTKSDTYTVALWQQLGKGDAQTSPNALLYSTPKRGVDSPNGGFNWTVQLYDFDLNVSNQFFLWLCDGVNSHPCSGSGPSMLSSYFAIRDGGKQPAVTSTESVTTSSTTTSRMPAGTASTIQTPLPPTTTDSLEKTGTSYPSPKSSQNRGSEEGGLSTGSVAAIAVACTVVAIVAICALFLWYRYLQHKRQHMLAEKQQRQRPWYGQEQLSQPAWTDKVGRSPWMEEPQHCQPVWTEAGISWAEVRPVRMSTPREPVELSAGPPHGYNVWKEYASRGTMEPS